MLAEVRGGIDTALSALTSTATDAQTLMRDMSGEVRAILASADNVSKDIKVIIGNVRAGRGTVGKLVNDDALYASVKSVAADAEKAMSTVRQASEDARAAIADFRGEQRPIRA